MYCQLTLPGGRCISYELVRSRVKNINMCIYSDGRIRVSAPSHVGIAKIESFIRSKEAFVLKALERKPGTQPPAALTEAQKAELRRRVYEAVDKLLPRFDRYAVRRPEIGFRDMTSRWGSCCKAKGWVHFNYRLIFYPNRCVEYVVAHELTHLVEANHSPAFYRVLEEVMPDWKTWRQLLKEKSY